jgi:hypothetical protein
MSIREGVASGDLVEEDLIRIVEERGLEIARHHRDFAAVSEICDAVYEGRYHGKDTWLTPAGNAIEEIRNIVG